jgi:hypothetical protein
MESGDMAVAKAHTSLEFLFTRMNYYTLQDGWATGFRFFETKPIFAPPSHPTALWSAALAEHSF